MHWRLRQYYQGNEAHVLNNLLTSRNIPSNWIHLKRVRHELRLSFQVCHSYDTWNRHANALNRYPILVNQVCPTNIHTETGRYHNFMQTMQVYYYRRYWSREIMSSSPIYRQKVSTCPWLDHWCWVWCSTGSCGR